MSIQKNDWYKGVSREFSYFMTLEIIKAYENMYEKYEFSFCNVLFHMENGVLTLIRTKTERDQINDFIERLSKQEIIEQLQKAACLFDELKAYLKNCELNPESWKELISLSRKLWTYNLFCIYFGYITDRPKMKKIVDENYALIKKVRNEINDLQILEDFLRNYQYLDLTNLSVEEIMDYLEKNVLPDDEKLKRRKEDFLIITKNLKPIEIQKDKIKETINKYLSEENVSKLKEVKGMVVFQGDVSGKAKIVLKKNQLSKIEKGDILVTIMTNPEFVTHLSKVAGIITDYGGATCHASIIAREMRIPCIVGTEHATKVFKDGDIVEINSKKGVARKL